MPNNFSSILLERDGKGVVNTGAGQGSPLLSGSAPNFASVRKPLQLTVMSAAKNSADLH